jgi:TonB-linked SusC/RagA family outer membrane protein
VKNKVDYNLKVGGKNIREMAYIKSPNMSVWEYDKNGQPTGEYFTPIRSYQGNGVSFYNPVAVANLGQDIRETHQLGNTFMLQFRLGDILTFRESVTFQYLGKTQNTFLPYNAIGADWLSSAINSAGESNNINQGLRTETQLIFASPFQNKDHQLSGVFSWITNAKTKEGMGISSRKAPSVNNPDPSVDAHVGRISTGMSEEMNLSAVANVNYKFLDRYMLQTNFRPDGSSSFGENNRWGLFYGIAAGWRFSNEPFLNSLDFLNDSKLRLSWGVSGNKPSDVYARFASYNSTKTGSYILNPAISASSSQLDNLKWETISGWDVGLDLSLFDNRIYLEGVIYKKVTDDILFPNYEIPYSSGYNNLRFLNGGQMTNNGWELMFDWKIIRTKDWYLSTNFNISRNTNVFNELPDNFNNERSTSIGNGQFPQVVIEGEPIGSFYGFNYLGVWASDQDVVAKDADGNVLKDSEGVPIPFTYTNSYTFAGGDAIYRDVNYDGNIDLNDVVYLGNSNPRFLGGFGGTLKYKNFDLSVSFNYRTGFDIVNGVAIQTEGMTNKNNQSTAVLRRWQVQGQNEVGMLPRAYMNHPANNLGSDRYVEKGDFLRMSSLKIGYKLNKNICQKMGIKNARFSLSARKLFTFTNYTGQDPEIGQGNDPFWMGVDEARTPPPQVYTFSIGVGF